MVVCVWEHLLDSRVGHEGLIGNQRFERQRTMTLRILNTGQKWWPCDNPWGSDVLFALGLCGLWEPLWARRRNNERVFGAGGVLREQHLEEQAFSESWFRNLPRKWIVDHDKLQIFAKPVLGGLRDVWNPRIIFI
jgi:hypothetical protein